MKIFMVFAIMLGVSSMMAAFYDFAPDTSAEKTVAVNYAVYRNEVFRYVFSGAAPNGDIASSSLKLPQGWQPLRPWKARVENGYCYVYGAASGKEIDAVRELFLGSFAVGRAYGGMLQPQLGNPVPVPAFVPENSLVSIVGVK